LRGHLVTFGRFFASSVKKNNRESKHSGEQRLADVHKMSRHQGINIRDAIAILAARPKHDEEGQVKYDKTMCDTLKTMGQQIDLFPPQQDVNLEATAEAMQGISNKVKQTAISQ